MSSGAGRPATPAEVALSDQWGARLRDLVNRVQKHRSQCPAREVFCIGAGVETELEEICPKCLATLLAVALTVLADVTEGVPNGEHDLS